MPKAIFIRHAESVANAGEKTQDPVSTALSAKGVVQAEEFAKTIVTAPTLLVSSPFDRARNTALPVARRFPAVPLEEWAIQEFTYLSPDKYHGTTVQDRMANAAIYWERGDSLFVDGPGAESFQNLIKRCEATVERLKKIPSGTVLLFSHQQFVSAIRWHLEGRFKMVNATTMREFRRFLVEQPIENCGRYEVNLGPH